MTAARLQRLPSGHVSLANTYYAERPTRLLSIHQFGCWGKTREENDEDGWSRMQGRDCEREILQTGARPGAAQSCRQMVQRVMGTA